MIAKTYCELFATGCNELASTPKVYGSLHKNAGFNQDEWELLTQEECWTRNDARKMAAIISNAVSITLNIASLPAVALPGAYVAMVIRKLVAPCNRIIAAHNAPESYDAQSAVGIISQSEVVTTTKEQMIALVLLFTGFDIDLGHFPVDGITEENLIAEQASE